ncbi:hypothetical protein Ancab_005675 [Ancistrocladus abbreviatus]
MQVRYFPWPLSQLWRKRWNFTSGARAHGRLSCGVSSWQRKLTRNWSGGRFDWHVEDGFLLAAVMKLPAIEMHDEIYWQPYPVRCDLSLLFSLYAMVALRE